MDAIQSKENLSGVDLVYEISTQGYLKVSYSTPNGLKAERRIPWKANPPTAILDKTFTAVVNGHILTALSERELAQAAYLVLQGKEVSDYSIIHIPPFKSTLEDAEVDLSTEFGP